MLKVVFRYFGAACEIWCTYILPHWVSAQCFLTTWWCTWHPQYITQQQQKSTLTVYQQYWSMLWWFWFLQTHTLRNLVCLMFGLVSLCVHKWNKWNFQFVFVPSVGAHGKSALNVLQQSQKWCQKAEQSNAEQQFEARLYREVFKSYLMFCKTCGHLYYQGNCSCCFITFRAAHMLKMFLPVCVCVERKVNWVFISTVIWVLLSQELNLDLPAQKNASPRLIHTLSLHFVNIHVCHILVRTNIKSVKYTELKTVSAR